MRARSTCCRCTASRRSTSATRPCAHDFLERQLERREAAGDALAALDASRLEALAAEVRADAGRVEQRLATRLDGESAWDAARADVRELRFLAKLAADIDDMQAELEF